MREYLLGIFLLVFLLGVCRMIGYKSEDDVGVRFAFAVLVIYTVLTPALNGDFNIGKPDIKDFEIDVSDYSEDYKKVCREAFTKGVHTLICSEFSLDGEDVRITVDGFDIERMRAERITVFLSGRAALADNKRIEKYIFENELGECDVRIELG